MVESKLTLPAFAKINLSLCILGKRDDGYHELDTIFQTISLHDSITIAVSDDPAIVLSCDDRSLPLDGGNLVWRAAGALQAHASIKMGARIQLEKRIPVQAGLGGGSSDTAVTLLGLARLWEITASNKDLLEIANEFGADVPFFFCGGTARGTGTGNQIAPLSDAPEKFLLVVKPNAKISTRQAYGLLKARALTTSEPKSILSSSLTNAFFDSFGADALPNDFEAVAFQLEPEIARAKAALMQAGARLALLAGSGSAVFGIFDNRDAQERAIQTIDLEPGWRVFPCNTVGRNRYRSAMGAASEMLTGFTGA